MISCVNIFIILRISWNFKAFVTHFHRAPGPDQQQASANPDRGHAAVDHLNRDVGIETDHLSNKDSRVGLERRIVRDAVGEEIAPAEFIETREPRLRVERLFFQWLEDHRVANLADPHLGPIETEFFRQADGLTTAVHEQLGGCAHDPLLVIDAIDKYITPPAILLAKAWMPTTNTFVDRRVC
jgi:hypothetical protein